jgi:hypothetical protein
MLGTRDTEANRTRFSVSTRRMPKRAVWMGAVCQPSADKSSAPVTPLHTHHCHRLHGCDILRKTSSSQR